MTTSSVPNNISVPLWQGEQFKGRFSELHQSLSHQKSCIVITGDKGVGKSTLINHFVKSLDEQTLSLCIGGAQEDELAFYSAIAIGFGVGTQFSSKVQFLLEFSNFLFRCDEEKKRVILVIDDCHLLTQPLLEVVRQIANVENDGKRLLHLFLIGDSAFDPILDRSRNKALRFSLALRCKIEPFSLKDTAEYVNFRLESIGHKETVFCLKGLEVIHKATRGIVRDINSLCEHVLAGNDYGIAVELSALYDSVEQLGLGGQVEAEPVAIIADHEIQQQKEEKKILYQSPEPEELESADEPKIELSSNDRPKRPLAFWLILFLCLAAAAGGGFFWLFQSKQEQAEQEVKDEVELVVPLVKPTEDASEDAPSVRTETVKAAEQESVTEFADEAVAQDAGSEVENAAIEPVTALPDSPEFPADDLEEKEPTAAEEQGEEVDVGQDGAVVDDTVEEQAVDKPIEEVAQDSLVQLEDEQQKDSQSIHRVLPTKPEPTLKPLKSIEEPPSAEEQLAESLDKEEAIIELNTVSKKRVVSEQEESSYADNKAPYNRTYIFRLKPNSSEMTAYYKGEFEEFVDLAQQNLSLSIEVRGYVSSDNDTDENRELSRKRAIQVYKMLIDKGIDHSRIEVKGMGVKDPIASNRTPQGRNKNRRVEVEFVKENN